MGIVGAVSCSRNIRNGTFHYYLLFLIEAVGTENVSFPKPVNIALCPVDRSHRLSKPRFAIHPPAQFLSSVLVNNSDLIDRKSTRLNSSHANISYAVFCLKKKKKNTMKNTTARRCYNNKESQLTCLRT